jgi:hypothetical protein
LSSLFLRILKHLAPTGAAWTLTVEKTLRRFFTGLSEQPQLTKDYIDLVYLDLFPETTRELNEWERQFGLSLTDMSSAPAVVAGRLALAAEWKATGGQSPSYIQGVLRTAGFDVYVHEWWSSGPPYVARDPRDYTNQPLIGLYQCTGEPLAPLPSQPQCSAFASQPQCNGFLANDPHYLVNKDLTLRPPPHVPNDPTKWPYFLYVGGQTFPAHAVVDITRRAEFERLILKLRPTQNWIVTLIDFEAVVGSHLLTEGGDIIVTEPGDQFVVE